jgi:adenosylcobinamide amidohydrolase
MTTPARQADAATAPAPSPVDPLVSVTCETYGDGGTGPRRPVLVWRFERPVRAVSSAVLGGGIGPCQWVLNAEVALGYSRCDPRCHLQEIAAELGLAANGAGLLTAARVRDFVSAREDGVRCEATVGLSFPVWPAAPADAPSPAMQWRPGTVNLVCTLPVPLSDAALVNAVVTATEAKTQALLEAGVPGTGTASDAVVVCCPAATAARAGLEPFCGPRSAWGARLARVVHAAVADGAAGYASRCRADAGVPARLVPQTGEAPRRAQTSSRL